MEIIGLLNGLVTLIIILRYLIDIKRSNTNNIIVSGKYLFTIVFISMFIFKIVAKANIISQIIGVILNRAIYKLYIADKNNYKNNINA